MFVKHCKQEEVWDCSRETRITWPFDDATCYHRCFGSAEEKAKTIAELAAMYDSTSCKECHPEIHAQWEKSIHARSIFGDAQVGRTAATIKTTIENGLKEWPHSGVKDAGGCRCQASDDVYEMPSAATAGCGRQCGQGNRQECLRLCRRR